MVGHGGPTASLSRFLVLGYGSELFKFEVSNLAVTGGEVTCTAYHWGPLSTSEIGSSRGQRIGSESYREFATSRLGQLVSARGCLGSRVVAPPQFRWRLRNKPAAHVEQTGHTAVAAEGGRRPLKDGTVTMSTNATCTFRGACGERARGGGPRRNWLLSGARRAEVSHYARKYRFRRESRSLGRARPRAVKDVTGISVRAASGVRPWSWPT